MDDTIIKFFLPTKSWKNHPQKLLRKTQIHIFSLLPAQPKRPKQKNSCSRMWLIDQLYIELGFWNQYMKTDGLKFWSLIKTKTKTVHTLIHNKWNSKKSLWCKQWRKSWYVSMYTSLYIYVGHFIICSLLFSIHT